MKALKFLDKHLEESLMVLTMVGIIVVMLFQIFFRYVLNNSLSWSEEFCRYCYIWMMFLAYAYCARLGTDLRVDAVICMLPSKAKAAMDLINLVLCVSLSAFLFYHSFGTVAAVIKTGESSVALHLPMYYVYTASVVGYGLATVRYTQQVILFFLNRNKKIEVKEG